jgi:hypothetical protein
MQVYIHRNNQQLGPFTEAEIKAQLAAGTISLQDHVWWEGQPGWMALSQSAFATAVSAGMAPPHPAPHPGVFVPASRVASAPADTGEQTSQLALWSLICGCLTLVCGIFTGIPAIVLGHMGLAEIKKTPALKGRGMAMFGLIMGYVILPVLTVVSIIVLETLGNQVQDTYKQLNQLSESAQSTNSADQSTNNLSPSTNSPDQATNTPDQSTNSSTSSTNSSDQTTNSSNQNADNPSTNSPDTSTNAAPMNSN